MCVCVFCITPVVTNSDVLVDCSVLPAGWLLISIMSGFVGSFLQLGFRVPYAVPLRCQNVLDNGFTFTSHFKTNRANEMIMSEEHI